MKQIYEGFEEFEEFSLKDLEKTHSIFTGIFICLQIALMLGLIYAGWKNLAWFLAIPIGGILWISNKILKRTIRNTVEDVTPLAHLREAQTQAVETRAFDSSAEDAIEQTQHKHAIINAAKQKPPNKALSNSIIFIALFFGALLPAALWYSIGLGVAAIFR